MAASIDLTLKITRDKNQKFSRHIFLTKCILRYQALISFVKCGVIVFTMCVSFHTKAILEDVLSTSL